MALNTKPPAVKAFQDRAPAADPPRRKRPDELTDEDFDRVMSGAIDYRPEADVRPVKGRMVGRKIQTTLTIAPPLMAWLDAFAERRGLSRTACIILAISEMRERNGG